MKPILALAALILALTGCKQSNKPSFNSSEDKTVADTHSFSNPHEAKVKHLNLEVIVDFESKKINGKAAYEIEQNTEAKEIIFDTRALEITTVTDAEGKELDYQLGKNVKYLGRALHVPITQATKRVIITYQTTDSSAALQWLNPEQTAGKKHPFLFTQSQAILARAWLPCQDSPGIRYTYTANVQVPSHLLAVMSAQNPQQKAADGKYTFTMNKPIPAYLMALSVGDLDFAAISDRTGVYAEPVTLQKALYEFADLEKMVKAAESLYGQYRWQQYDLLVLPPSFPFGGMENPKATFVTPTILAGDRSLTSLIAHELAHSWSGNLVTNATWNDFWLNEGFTVYFERRIMEQLYGKPYADMLHVLSFQDLQATLNEMGASNPGTRLKLDLKGRDPDEGLTDIAYEKGNFFLKTVELHAGREKLDQFLSKYFNAHAFGTITTEQFLKYFDQELIAGNTELREKINPEEWIYKPGLPENCPTITSERFAAVDEQVKKFNTGTNPKDLNTKNWSSHEWLHFLRQLPEVISQEQMASLDAAFNFTNSGNSEILFAWLIHVVPSSYEPAYAALDRFLVLTGRRKFLTPLYEELLKTEKGKEMAKDIYQRARPNYHSVSTNTLDELFKANAI